MSLDGIGDPSASWCGICQRYHQGSSAVCVPPVGMVSTPTRKDLQHAVYAWLGYYRDRMPSDLVTTLQRVLGPLE